MSIGNRSAYFRDLLPYFKLSVAIFAAGAAAGLVILTRFPEAAGYVHASLGGFVKMFQGLTPLRLAGAIFLNNALKTLAAIVSGFLFGIVPAIYLLANGAALGIALTLSAQSRGPWLSLLSIAPHGIVELPAVFLGTGIGFKLGAHAVQSIFKRTQSTLGAEMLRGLKFFGAVIVPLLLVAALVEAYITAPLVAPR
jgi:stage II sporulation protein M